MNALEKQILKHKKTILSDSFIVIDPATGATSDPGWCVFTEGELVAAGILSGNPTADATWAREALLLDMVIALRQRHPQVQLLVIERIRGRMANISLLWAVGISLAAMGCPFIEMPVMTWKKHAGWDHVKSDKNDAIAMGKCIVAIARGEYAVQEIKKKYRKRKRVGSKRKRIHCKTGT